MLSILLRVMTLTWRNAFLSITRYVINTATHKGSPHSNKTVIKWFLVAITITIIIFTFFPIYHVATDSVQIQAFCSQFNVQDNVTYQNNSVSPIESPNAPPNMFKYQWILTLAHFALMLLGAALGFAHRVLTARFFGAANHPPFPPSANSRVYLKKNFALKYLALIAQW